MNNEWLDGIWRLQLHCIHTRQAPFPVLCKYQLTVSTDEPQRHVPFEPHLPGEETGTERLGHLSRVTQPLRSTARAQAQAAPVQGVCSQPQGHCPSSPHVGSEGTEDQRKAASGQTLLPPCVTPPRLEQEPGDPRSQRSIS